MARSPRARLTCSIARRASSTRCSAPTIARFPKLRVVFEHITTARAAEFVQQARDGVAATITPQHLLHNRNAIFEGGIRPHYYCLPILKTEPDRDGAARGRHQRQSALLPRHRQRAARATHQGERLRLRRHVLGARGHRAVRGSVRGGGQARQARRVRVRLRRGFLRLPRNTERIRLAKRDWRPPANYPFRPSARTAGWCPCAPANRSPGSWWPDGRSPLPPRRRRRHSPAPPLMSRRFRAVPAGGHRRRNRRLQLRHRRAAGNRGGA